MKKTIILSILASIFAYVNIAKADISLSGYAEWLAGSVDQTTLDSATNHGRDRSGFDNGTYTRMDATYSTTLDSGIAVRGDMTVHSRDCMGDRQDNCDVTNNNFITFSGDFGAISFGERFAAGASMLSRLTASGPTAEPDGNNMQYFYEVGDATYGGGNEVNYADNAPKIMYSSNVYNGFSFAASYSSYTGNHGIAGEAQAQQASGATAGATWSEYSDFLSAFGKYAIDIDGFGVELVYGVQLGNAGRDVGTDYNDLDESAYSVLLTYGNFKADYRKNEAGDSGRPKNDGSGNDEGTTICGTYTMGNLGIGYCNVDTTFTTSSNTTNENKMITYNAEYQLGGGVSFSATYFDHEQTENNVVDTDAEGIVTRLAIGF
jgi:hypothetical protein